MQQAGANQSTLARAAAIDRSTVSQILATGTTRLPNAQVVAEIAAALGISADWLLGLTDRPESAAELMAESLLMTEAPRANVDANIEAWLHEAEGYKIRHVPASLPDILKTESILEWEYGPHLGRTPDQAIASREVNLRRTRDPLSDYEIAMPISELTSFAHAEGYYRGLSVELRREQLNRIRDLHDQLYPRLRLFLFDAHRVFSSPVTIFGPLLAAIYLGRNYVVFRDSERIRGIAGHFDWLIREAEISARAVPDFVDNLQVEAGLDRP